jgi:tight adherence protein B
MTILPYLVFAFGVLGALAMVFFALAGPGVGKAQSRRLEGVRVRHSDSVVVAAQAQMRRVATSRDTKATDLVSSFLPNPALLAKRIAMTGKTWTLGQYATVSAGLVVFFTFVIWFKGGHILLAIAIGLFVGLWVPHFVVGWLVKRRVNQFTSRFPDAIDLLVRGLRSGLPIGETLTVVGAEVPDPVGSEFRAVSDKMKIGRTMEAALQETADRLGTPEFQFFVITLAIQRETGGNLAETLANLSDVLRKRAQMKLKIKAMSSESKASAYIVGSLPFIVFALIWFVNNEYMSQFFKDERLMIGGGGGLIWMGVGCFIMSKMVNFEI